MLSGFYLHCKHIEKEWKFEHCEKDMREVKMLKVIENLSKRHIRCTNYVSMTFTLHSQEASRHSIFRLLQGCR